MQDCVRRVSKDRTLQVAHQLRLLRVTALRLPLNISLDPQAEPLYRVSASFPGTTLEKSLWKLEIHDHLV